MPPAISPRPFLQTALGVVMATGSSLGLIVHIVALRAEIGGIAVGRAARRRITIRRISGGCIAISHFPGRQPMSRCDQQNWLPVGVHRPDAGQFVAILKTVEQLTVGGQNMN